MRVVLLLVWKMMMMRMVADDLRVEWDVVVVL